jgi:plasmid stabilization system protein ParE
MKFTIKLRKTAQKDFSDIHLFLNELDASSARKHVTRLADAIEQISGCAQLYSFFFLTGTPYRAKFFEIGRTSFSIVYRLDEAADTIDILRIWNSRQDPGEFEF